jgi:glyoxylase-like metal-dependent hydrolase (beta-lactamase superfamily II)/8-oxo-dGTP pyrophosphatase MutT (NUDIX family)
VAVPRSSAVVLLFRRDALGQRELLWLHRGHALEFGGFYAFPGGKVEETDERTPVVGAVGDDAVLRATAARELLEETGILVAQGADELSEELIGQERERLLSGDTTFAAICERYRLSIPASTYVDAGRWITPEFMPVRFDTRFFVVELPLSRRAGTLRLEGGSEADELGFVGPEEALARWRDGRALLHPPTHNAFAAFALPGERMLERLRHPPFVKEGVSWRIEFQEGIVLVPQRTPTLPPATHTNCYLVGRTRQLIVDPGAADASELAQLYEVIDCLRAEGREPLAIALTHHHHDHVAGVPALAGRYKLPIWAHPSAAERLGPAGIRVDRSLADGEVLDLGDLELTALHTPGHTRDHLCFLEVRSGALLAGDLVSSVSTIVIDPPEGNMASYLESLRGLLQRGVHALYPAHGPVVADGPGKLRAYLEHRLEREGQILAALRRGLGTPRAIVPSVYIGTPEPLFPFAERSVQAHLDKLEAEGKVVVRGSTYTVGSP